MKINEVISLFEEKLTDAQIMQIQDQEANGEWSDYMTAEELIDHDNQIIEESKKKIHK